MSDRIPIIDHARSSFDYNLSRQEDAHRLPELPGFRDLWLDQTSKIDLENWRQSPRADLNQYQLVPLIKGFFFPLGSSAFPYDKDDHTRIDDAYACFMDGILGYGIEYTHENGVKELISLITFLVDMKKRSLGILQMQGGNTKELFKPGEEITSESPIVGQVYARDATKNGRKALSKLTNGNQLLYELVLSLSLEADISHLGIQRAQSNRSEELRNSRQGREKYYKFARTNGHTQITSADRYYWRKVEASLS